jgi:hypothetical protein
VVEKKKNEAVVFVELNNETIERAKTYIKMVASKIWLGTTLLGEPGIGKTLLVRKTLESMNLVEGKDFVMFGGHITLAQAYQYLYENFDKIIFWDDVSSVISNPEIVELLKQAIGNTGYERRLHYRSTGVLPAEIRKDFCFTGRCIFTFNTMDKTNPNVKAIMDRAPTTELVFSRAEKIEMMYKIAKAPGNELTEAEKLIVTREIEKSTDATMDISLRKQALAFQFFRFSKEQYGDGNTTWVDNVRGIFGKKKEHPIAALVRELVGMKSIRRKDLAKEIAVRKNMCFRNAQRLITDAVELEVIYQDKMKQASVSLVPFNARKEGECE